MQYKLFQRTAPFRVDRNRSHLAALEQVFAAPLRQGHEGGQQGPALGCDRIFLIDAPIGRRRGRDLVYAASATGSLYRSFLAIMAQTIRAILFASAIAVTLVGRRASKAVSQGRCLVPMMAPWCRLRVC